MAAESDLESGPLGSDLAGRGRHLRSMPELVGRPSPRSNRAGAPTSAQHARGPLAAAESQHRLSRRRDPVARDDAQPFGLPYGADDQFRTTIAPFLVEGIERSEALLAVTTGANLELLREYLGKDARSVEFVDASAWYSTPSAALEAYSAFIDAKLKRGAAWVRIVGEPIWAGRSDAEVRVWTDYESLLNLVFSAYPLTLVCPYDEKGRSLRKSSRRHTSTHPHAVGHRGISNSPDYTIRTLRHSRPSSADRACGERRGVCSRAPADR